MGSEPSTDHIVTSLSRLMRWRSQTKDKLGCRQCRGARYNKETSKWKVSWTSSRQQIHGGYFNDEDFAVEVHDSLASYFSNKNISIADKRNAATALRTALSGRSDLAVLRRFQTDRLEVYGG